MKDQIQQEFEQAASIYNLIIEFFVNYSFQIVGAIFILLAGLLVARKVGNIVLGLCEKKNFDITLSRFLASFCRITVVVMVAIIALGKVGISITPFIAAVGALSLGAGLAVQGLVSNYGAGLNIILTRPFVVGDTICVQGTIGQVKEVHLAFTVLTNEDQTQINIPNKHIVGEIIHNSFQYTLAELSIGIAYSEDPENAVKLLQNAINSITAIDAEEKQPLIGIESFGDSAINLGVRVWLPTQSYVKCLYEVNHCIYATLKQNGVQIPFPQREVRILSEELN